MDVTPRWFSWFMWAKEDNIGINFIYEFTTVIYECLINLLLWCMLPCTQLTVYYMTLFSVFANKLFSCHEVLMTVSIKNCHWVIENISLISVCMNEFSWNIATELENIYLVKVGLLKQSSIDREWIKLWCFLKSSQLSSPS